MRPERHRLRVLRPKVLHDLRPQQPRRPQLGDLGEDVHPDPEEERDARGEVVDAEAGAEAGAEVFEAVGEGVGELELGGGAGLLHVVAADRDGVEAGHALGAVGNDVADDPHRRAGRVDVGVADHELLEDVVLDGPAELLHGHPLLLGRHDIKRHDRQDGPVHRHGDGHLIERNPLEEPPHVLDGVDGDAGLPHVARHAHMVGVVAAVGGEVEGDREPPLPRPQRPAVERVRFLG